MVKFLGLIIMAKSKDRVIFVQMTVPEMVYVCACACMFGEQNLMTVTRL